MRKRPLAAGAVIFFVILYLCSFFGVSDPTPRYEQLEGKRIRIAGRIASREEFDTGMRLILKECSISFLYESSSFSKQFFQTISKEDRSESEILNRRKQNSSESAVLNHQNSNPMIFQNAIEYRGTQDPALTVLVSLGEKREHLLCGSWVIAEGICSFPESPGNPGQFDQRRYDRIRGIDFRMKQTKILQQWNPPTYSGFLDGIRQTLAESTERILGEEDAAVITAITLGKREKLSADQKQLYQEGGIAHILAISSLHITLIGMGIYRLLRRCRWPIFVCSLVSAGVLFSFCVMTGMSISARRALLMYLLWLGSQILGRTSDPPTGLALASFVILLPFPEAIRDSGFLLSFGCVLSLLYVTPLMKKLLPVPGRLGTAIQSSAAIQVGTVPLLMMFYYQVTPYAFLINLAVLPFLAVLMFCGLAGSLIGIFCVPAGVIAAAPCHYLLQWFETLCRMEKKLPGAVWITGCPAGWQTAVYYGILLMLCIMNGRRGNRSFRSMIPGKKGADRHRKAKGSRQVFLVFFLLMIGILSFRETPRLRITFLDVGQGDGILIQSQGRNYLVDGGSSSVDQVWQYRMEPALKYYGISRLDGVLVSHGDKDHISGIQELLESYEPGIAGNAGGITVERLILPDTGYEEESLELLRTLAKRNGISAGTLGKGGRIQSGDLELSCLAPDPENAVGDSNQDSMVLYLKYKNSTALFTGDLELEGERKLLETFQGGEIDLLKVAHHGSKNGTSEEFLRQMLPKASVISCGKGNPYGHPAAEVLDRLEQWGSKVCRTDQGGAVTVEWRDGELCCK